MPIMDQMSIPMPMVSYVTGGQRTVIQNIETSEIDMVGTSTYSTMRVECIVFYVDPKSVGSLNFLGKEQNIRLS